MACQEHSQQRTPDSRVRSGSTSGQHTIQLLKFAGYTNVVAAASKKHEELLKALGAAHVVDYNSSSFAEEVVAVAGGKVELVVESIALPSTFALIKDVIKAGGKLAYLVPFKPNAGGINGTDGDLVQEAPKEIKDTLSGNVSFTAVSTFFFQKVHGFAVPMLQGHWLIYLLS